MQLTIKEVTCYGLKISIKDYNSTEIGRAFIYVAYNDLRKKPFALMEDLFIKEGFRGQGLGRLLIQKVIQKARELGCYKLIATSRYSRKKVHNLYLKFGFKDYGKEFRINF